MKGAEQSYIDQIAGKLRDSPAYSRSILIPRAAMIVKYARDYGVHPYLLPAVAGAETSFGCSTNPEAVYDRDVRHNVLGWGPHYSYPTFEAAFVAWYQGMAGMYRTRGLNTLQQIGDLYSPPASNPDWLPNVKHYFQWFGGDPETPSVWLDMVTTQPVTFGLFPLDPPRYELFRRLEAAGLSAASADTVIAKLG